MNDRIATAILVAGALIAAALYLRPSSPPPRYAISAGDGGFVRLDNETGEVRSCSGGSCIRVIEPNSN